MYLYLFYRDLEESESVDRDEIIRLGTTYGLASSETSFVAVELESKEETKKSFNLYSSSDVSEQLPRSSSQLDFRASTDSISRSSDTITSNNSNSSSIVSPTSNVNPGLLLVPPSPGKSGKKVYAPDFLLRFQRVSFPLFKSNI